MPILGEIRKGDAVGYKRDGKLIWRACVRCGKERWVRLEKGCPKNPRCNPCAHNFRGQTRSKHPCWKGGRIVSAPGYVLIKVYEDSPFFPMAESKGYVFEHRIVVAKHLGRCLTADEQVHHLNGIKDDNRQENLWIVTNQTHPKTPHHLNNALKKRIRELELQLRK